MKMCGVIYMMGAYHSSYVLSVSFGRAWQGRGVCWSQFQSGGGWYQHGTPHWPPPQGYLHTTQTKIHGPSTQGCQSYIPEDDTIARGLSTDFPAAFPPPLTAAAWLA